MATAATGSRPAPTAPVPFMLSPFGGLDGGCELHIPKSGEELRAWASRCRAQANEPRLSSDERARLLKMSEALIVVANTQDWLDGKEKSPRVRGARPHR